MQRESRGEAAEHTRAYLDRVQPKLADCPRTIKEIPSANVSVSCGACTLMPARWQLTVTGIINQLCTTCADFNGTYTLVYAGSGCVWQTAELGPCDSSKPRYKLDYDTGSQEWLLRPAVDRIYSLARASFKCQEANTLTLKTVVGTSCTGWPSSMTISPTI